MTNPQELIVELTKLGLNEREAIVYKAALSLGTFSIASLSFQTKIKRPTCYFTISNLMEKGLISKLAQSKKAIYMAEHPRQLVAHIKKNLFRAEQLSKELEQESNLGQKPKVQILTGQGGLEKIYQDMVSVENTEVCSFLDTKSLLGRTGDYFLKDWISERQKKNVSIKSLTDANPDFTYKTNKDELRVSRVVSDEIKLNGSIGVYGDKVVYISNSNDDFSLIVDNKGFKESLLSIFNYIWNRTK